MAVVKFGQVGRLKVDRNSAGPTDITFMVIGKRSYGVPRGIMFGYDVLVLEGVGYDSDRREPGDIGLVAEDEPEVEWLT